MIFLMLMCFSDLICAPMDTAAAEEEWGNGKHDSSRCLEVRSTQTACACMCVKAMTMKPPDTL